MLPPEVRHQCTSARTASGRLAMANASCRTQSGEVAGVWHQCRARSHGPVGQNGRRYSSWSVYKYFGHGLLAGEAVAGPSPY